MLDPKYLRLNSATVAAELQKKNYRLDVEGLNALEQERKELQQITESLQSERKKKSKTIGNVLAQKSDVSELKKEMEALNAKLTTSEKKLHNLHTKLERFLSDLPNIPDITVPEGKSDKNNKEIRRWGKPKVLNFKPADHVDLAEPLGLDFESAAKISGARFSVIRGKIAKLYRALMQFMIDIQVNEHGYEEVMTPLLVHSHALFGTGQLPKFEEDMFKIQCAEGDMPHYLISTAEITLTNLLREQIIDAENLPIKFVSCTPCFRREAGSSGKDTRGILRQHQFDKVELVQIVHPNFSWDVLEQMVIHGEEILQRLELPYRVVSLCGGDLGFSAAKTYDIEAWLPGQNRYREISSMSNCLDFQARRMKARFRSSHSRKKIEWVHTLNGSGLAVGRTLIALIENGQDCEGNIHIPESLRPYLQNQSIITK